MTQTHGDVSHLLVKPIIAVMVVLWRQRNGSLIIAKTRITSPLFSNCNLMATGVQSDHVCCVVVQAAQV